MDGQQQNSKREHEFMFAKKNSSVLICECHVAYTPTVVASWESIVEFTGNSFLAVLWTTVIHTHAHVMQFRFVAIALISV